MGQPTADPASSNSGNRCSETSVGTSRQAGEHIVFSEPARPACTFDDKPARRSICRLEMPVIARWDFHSRCCGNVEARLVVQQDYVWKLPRRMANCSGRPF